MKIALRALSFLVGLLFGTNLVLADEQREFPTGEPGTNVTYLDAGGPGHPTGCIVVITAGLPALALSFAFFSNNVFTVTAASEQPIGNIVPGGAATVKVNPVYIFAKVAKTYTEGHFHVVQLNPLENTPLKAGYDAMNQIVYNPVSIDIVADGAQLPHVSMSAKPGVGDALTACQRYMVTR